ncbi:polysaccharide lyase family 4 protein [Saccharata proteae CBS 121410]|uniref:rhamnogalacturonan endolyase n=1 Tax=Saccharata proteae CBS 121410 TaxID=1314787 RepID=A0A9P4HW97_9PEZI|nr:polysaccharide lyase family 4 protein [Saccharata proteae CBS 121410]
MATNIWLFLLFLLHCCQATGPFLQSLNSTHHVIGNDLWNITQGPIYGTPLYYNDRELVGAAEGHYVGYNGENDLNFTSAEIYASGDDYIDVRFNATEGEMHWVIYEDLAGAYQYFVNHGLPVLGVFRTLVRLDNQTFTHGRTNIKDEALPPLSDILSGTKVQDETWLTANGTYITKYDWSDFIRTVDYYGVYGEEFGSWYIRPGTDYFNGDHLKQELMVHRESSTGDAVQLNVVHGTHFMASSSDAFPDGKVFGPWLWYLNNGSKPDASARHDQEFAAWPYSWFDNDAYQSRASNVSGTIVLSDGRPAAHAAVFLGDNNPNETSLDMGRYYYYTTYADASGHFAFSDVRSGTYGLQAWPGPSSNRSSSILANVTTTLIQNDTVIPATASSVDLGTLTWPVPTSHTSIFQIGAFDRTSLGFEHGGAPYQHGLVSSCPANLTYTIGVSSDSDWCFGQSALGSWNVEFTIDDTDTSIGLTTNMSSALLTVSLASYSKGTSASIYVNDQRVGNLTKGDIASDPSLYRSGTTAGEWHVFEFRFEKEVLAEGSNVVSFAVEESTEWRGWMWDSVLLELV